MPLGEGGDTGQHGDDEDWPDLDRVEQLLDPALFKAVCPKAAPDPVVEVLAPHESQADTNRQPERGRTDQEKRQDVNPVAPPWARRRRGQRVFGDAPHSHSIVPGGLLVTSRTTRLISGTSFVIRVEMCASTSYGSRVQSAVIASSDETGRKTTG